MIETIQKIKMTEELKELSNTLIIEIQKFVDNIKNFVDDNNEIKDIEYDENDSNEKKLQKQETWFDQMHEKYLKAVQLVENEELFQNLLKEFEGRIENFFNEYKQKKEILEINQIPFL